MLHIPRHLVDTEYAPCDEMSPSRLNTACTDRSVDTDGARAKPAFDEYTITSLPSLDQQFSFEVQAERELCMLICTFLARLSTPEEVEAAQKAVFSAPRIDINPYRPPRGHHLRQQMEDLHVEEWGSIKALHVNGTSLLRPTTPLVPPTNRPKSAPLRRPPPAPPSEHERELIHPGTRDRVLCVKGTSISVPPPGTFATLAAHGGVNEEVLAEDGTYEEVFAIDHSGGDTGTQRPRSALGSSSAIAMPCATELAHVEAPCEADRKREDMGLQPLSPRRSAREEISTLLFLELWRAHVVAEMCARLNPKTPKQSATKPTAGRKNRRHRKKGARQNRLDAYLDEQRSRVNPDLVDGSGSESLPPIAFQAGNGKKAQSGDGPEGAEPSQPTARVTSASGRVGIQDPQRGQSGGTNGTARGHTDSSPALQHHLDMDEGQLNMRTDGKKESLPNIFQKSVTRAQTAKPIKRRL